jgi:hypothetical protein
LNDSRRIGIRIGKGGEHLSLTCGLCCNGAIFADVSLRKADDPGRLRSIGLLLKGIRRGRTGAKGPRAGAPPALGFTQPCSAFDGCRCQIYPDRPAHCRKFDCLLLKRLQEDAITASAARATVRAAKSQVDQVLALLRELGDTDESLSLAKRFRRTSTRAEVNGLQGVHAVAYSQLTLAMHDLNLLLSESFYPGPGLRAS